MNSFDTSASCVQFIMYGLSSVPLPSAGSVLGFMMSLTGCIGLSSENVVENSVNNELLLEKIKTLAIAQK